LSDSSIALARSGSKPSSKLQLCGLERASGEILGLAGLMLLNLLRFAFGEILELAGLISLKLLRFARDVADDEGMSLFLVRFAGRRSGEDGALAGVLRPEEGPAVGLLKLNPRSADSERLTRATLGSFALEGAKLGVLKLS
jgi:hypothetical protein